MKGIESNAPDIQRVLIVGCGNIAGGFDERCELRDSPFTHAGAYLRDGRFNVTACIEPNDIRRKEFMSAWSVPSGFKSIDDLSDSYGRNSRQFDVISICSPTDFHAHDLEMALKLHPKIIFCEKPVTTSIEDTERLVRECNKTGISLAVNYTRRWDPDILKLKSEIAAGKWGELRSVVGIYNKGILNNGSHMLDLLHFLIGPVTLTNVGVPVIDYSPHDPTIPVSLEGENTLPIHLTCGHADDYAVFELQLIFSSGILTMEEGGMYWNRRSSIESEIFNGYRQLGNSTRWHGNYPKSMLHAVDNIYRAIASGAQLASNGESALSVQRVCTEILQESG